MTRQYNPQITGRNARLFDSKKGIQEQVANSPEALEIVDKGDRRYHYFISFTYDTRDGEVISCSADISKKLVEEFKKGLIGRAWIEVERKSNQLRIRKLVGFDRTLKMVRLENGEKYYLSGVASENSPLNVEETSQFAKNNLLETVLKFNHLQRIKQKQGELK